MYAIYCAETCLQMPPSYFQIVNIDFYASRRNDAMFHLKKHGTAQAEGHTYPASKIKKFVGV